MKGYKVTYGSGEPSVQSARAQFWDNRDYDSLTE